MYNAINQINSAIELLSSCIEGIKEALISDEDIDLSLLCEDLEDFKPFEINSALEAIYFSFGNNGNRDIVEDIYIKRIETELAFVIVNVIQNKKIVDKKLTLNPDNEEIYDIKIILEDLWSILEEIFLNIRFFYLSILGEDLSLKSFDSLIKEPLSINDLFEVIGYTDKSAYQKLSDAEKSFLDSFCQYCNENGIMEVTLRQLTDIATHKRIASRHFKRIPFMSSPTDAFRIANIFNITIAHANTIFDLNDKKITSNHNPKNNVNTNLDEYFREQYELLFKTKPSSLFTFDYCLPIK